MVGWLTIFILKVQITTAADSIWKCVVLIFRWKRLDISCESSDMNYQTLFSRNSKPYFLWTLTIINRLSSAINMMLDSVRVKRAAPYANVSLVICGQRMPRSACESAQSDQGLHCPLTQSLDTRECMNGERWPGWYFAYARVDLNKCIFRMFEGIFSLEAAYKISDRIIE